MFQNHFNVALRNILRYKGYSFIHIAGLAIYLAAGLSSIVIASLTVSFQAIKKAVVNPVNSLKYV